MAGMCRSKLMFGHPVITILGCTGTGKSKLAIELAKKFNGEIINADAMQMYQGLDIITNKVTTEEQEGIRHHLLGFLDPSKRITVAEYKFSALNAIREIIERKKLPIIVGGTFYYVESVLYDFVIGRPELIEGDEEDVDSSTESKDHFPRPRKRLKTADCDELEAELDKLDDESLHKRLREIDPEYAEKIHPKCRRKALRGIMVHKQFGETLSSILRRQKSQPGASCVGGPLKFTNSLMLLLQCDPVVLNKRLDDRVDDMLSRGLLKEILEFRNAHGSQVSDEAFVKGICQSIGFKEFQEFLKLDEEKRDSEEGKKIFEKGVDLLKLTTRQYAKQQQRWIKNRLLTDSQRQTPPIYKLDVSDLSKWEENVWKVAKEILDCHLVGKKPSVEPVVVEGKKTAIDKIYHCECGKYLEGKVQYEIHMKSKSHERRMKKIKQLENEEKEKAEETYRLSTQSTI